MVISDMKATAGLRHRSPPLFTFVGEFCDGIQNRSNDDDKS